MNLFHLFRARTFRLGLGLIIAVSLTSSPGLLKQAQAWMSCQGCSWAVLPGSGPRDIVIWDGGGLNRPGATNHRDIDLISGTYIWQDIITSKSTDNGQSYQDALQWAPIWLQQDSYSWNDWLIEVDWNHYQHLMSLCSNTHGNCTAWNSFDSNDYALLESGDYYWAGGLARIGN